MSGPRLTRAAARPAGHDAPVGRIIHVTPDSGGRRERHVSPARRGPSSVHRLGFGAMQITGPGIWGEPADRGRGDPGASGARSSWVVTFIDTADSLRPVRQRGPDPRGACTRTRPTWSSPPRAASPGSGPRPSGPSWGGRVPAPVRRDEPAPRSSWHDASTSTSCTGSTRPVPLADQIGVLTDLQQEGKIRHLGLSEVSVAELEAVRKLATIVSVQNLYNLTNRVVRGGAGPLRGQRHRVHPVVPDRHRPAGPAGWPAGRDRPPATARRRPSSRWPGCCAARR